MTVDPECDTCFHFECSPNIESFEVQSEDYCYRYLVKKLAYTPDFLVVDKVKGILATYRY